MANRHQSLSSDSLKEYSAGETQTSKIIALNSYHQVFLSPLYSKSYWMHGSSSLRTELSERRQG